MKAAGKGLHGVLSSPVSTLVRWAATVPSAAIPIAAEICSDALTIPEARPASASGTFAIAIVISGRNDSPAPKPSSANGTTIVGK